MSWTSSWTNTIPQTHKEYRERIQAYTISSLVRWLLAQPHFSLGSKVVSPIMDSCLTRTKGTGLDSMVLCLLLPKLRLCHMSQNLPSRQYYVTAVCRGNWIAQVSRIRLIRTIPWESVEMFITQSSITRIHTSELARTSYRWGSKECARILPWNKYGSNDSQWSLARNILHVWCWLLLVVSSPLNII